MTTSAPGVGTSAAEAYEKYLLPGIFEPWAERLMTIAAPQPGEQVLDVACGSGIGARLAALRVGPAGSVTGVDIDPAMVAVARQRAAGHCPTNWYCASVEDMPIAEGSFDLCLCLQGLQFFQDRVASLRSIRRALKPFGRLVAAAWASLQASPGHHALVQALDRQGVDTAAARKGFSFGDPDAMRAVAAAAGFSRIGIRQEEGHGRFASVRAFVDAIAAGSPSARYSLARLPDSGREAFLRDIESLLSPYVGTRGLEWPMRATVLIASA